MHASVNDRSLPPRGQAFADRRPLRPATKALPEQARAHNRSLVLQTLLSDGAMSRAELARRTGLTKVTVGELVAELLDAGLAREVGATESGRPGKPAILVDVAKDDNQCIGVDLSDALVFRGAVMTLDGEILERAELPIDGATGADAVQRVARLVDALVALATRPLLGIGIGTPGIVDLTGTVVSAPNLGWSQVRLGAEIGERTGAPVTVANDANVAALAEHGFGGASDDVLVVTIGHGVGAGLVLGGMAVVGGRDAAGEIGHVVVGTDGGPRCACGKEGCLEAWLAVPQLERALAASDDPDAVLAEAGTRLGIVLAPIVAMLNLTEVVLAGPEPLLAGRLSDTALTTLRSRILDSPEVEPVLRRSRLGSDIVTRGAAALVLSRRLGVA